MYRNLIAAAFALAFASTPSHALTFTFSFSNVTGNVSGTVGGEIFGLTDNATSAATAVDIESGPALLGLSLPISIPMPAAFNSFTVASGVITDSFFSAIFFLPDLNELNLFMESSSGLVFAGAHLSVQDILNNTFTTVTDDSSPVFTEVATTPLPAALPLFATGIGAMGLFGWRRKRKAAALAA